MSPSGERRFRLLAVVAALAACVGIAVSMTGVLAPVEADMVDARFDLRPERIPSDVAVVAVDDVTFSDLGVQWPLPRSMYARVLRRLERAGARLSVVDIQFTEPSKDPEEDLALFDALGATRGAILATSETDERGGSDVLGGDENLAEVGSRAAAANLPDLRGGVIRRFTHASGGLETIAVVAADRVGRRVPAGEFERAGAWIDYRGGPGTVPTLSLSDVYRGRFDPAAVRGRVVVIGASSPTIQDIHPTSTTGAGRLMSGPEIQANAIWTALHGLPLRSAPLWLDALFLLIASAAIPLLAVRAKVLLMAIALPVLGLALCAAAYAAFRLGTVVTLSPSLLALAVSGVGTVVASHLGESRERRRVALLAKLLDERVRERTQELSDAQLEIVSRLGTAVEHRDRETGDHVVRMSDLCHRLALAAGLTAREAELIRHASALHDVGKVAIPDAILLKKGLLTAEERAVMHTHTTIGGRILANSAVPLVQLGQAIALTHHERWDGEGYPARLAGEAIPLAGRIAAICDVYDALTSERTYKPAWATGEALAELSLQRGRSFDPRLVDAFLAMMADEEGLVPNAGHTLRSLAA